MTAHQKSSDERLELKERAPLMMEALLMMMVKALTPVLELMMALAPVEVMMQQRACLLMQKWEPVQERQLEALLPVGQDPVQGLQLEVLPQRMFLQQ